MYKTIKNNFLRKQNVLIFQRKNRMHAYGSDLRTIKYSLQG